ncbi:hypothetical protein EGW08_017277 [Elysia chlorotica]|uniref:Uncharacterized protein n=1 Tax=Elysia chlorotica TaxID=188477 RepID=A0A3S1B4Q8_ELYCH|nr:hypothetical protein EGW08_017277 [Elysia chlorotica]
MSPALYKGSQFERQISEASDLMAAPESEDIYAFLEGVERGAYVEKARSEHYCVGQSGEKERDSFAFTPPECGDETINPFHRENHTETLGPASPSFLENEKYGFEYGDKDLDEIDAIDPNRSDKIDMLTADNNGLYTLCLDKDQNATRASNNSSDSAINCHISAHSEDVGQGVLSFKPKLKSFTQPFTDVKEIHENLSGESSTTNTSTSTSSVLVSGHAEWSPQPDLSFDLFDDSCLTSSADGHQCLGAIQSQDLVETESTHRDNKILVMKHEKSSPENNQHHSLSVSTNRNYQKVRFDKRKQEFLFYDFEIISHLPVPSPQAKVLKSCLKEDQIPPETHSLDGCSQDLFDSPSQVTLFKSPDIEVNVSSGNNSSTNNVFEIWYEKNTNIVVQAATSLLCQDSINDSQELFSSGDTESPRTNAKSLDTKSSFAKKIVPESSAGINLSHEGTFYLLKHSSATAFQATDRQMLSRNTWPSAPPSHGSNRDSLDLFSQSQPVSQDTCDSISHPLHPVSLSLTPKCQKGKDPETPDLFSADSE